MTFKFSKSIQYSINSGITWVTLAANTNSPSVAKNASIMWRSSYEITPNSSNGCGRFTFSSTGKVKASGNPLSLVYGSNYLNNR